MFIFGRKITKKYFLILGVVVLAVFLMIGLNGKEKKEIAFVVRADLIQEVNITGKTKARDEVDLGFDIGGRVARSFVEVGDYIRQGTLIAELDNTSQLALISKEKAVLTEAEADYKDQGKNIALAIMDGYSTSDNAVRNKVDQFFKQPKENPQFEVKFDDGNFTHYFKVPSEVALELNTTRRSVERLLNEWKAELSLVTPDNAGQFSYKAIERMNTVSLFIDRVAYAINSFAPAEYQYESTVTGYKTAVDSARSTVATAKKSISTIGGVEAKLSQTKSSVSSLEADLYKTRIVAPFSGTVTLQEAKVGGIAKAGETLISMISESDMYIEANVSEINISKLNIGNIAKIVFDALPEEVFEGTVVFIDPGETIVDGVANYKVRIELQKMDERIKSGLTANINIETDYMGDALSIPIFAVTKKDGKSFVKKIEGGEVSETEITTGLIGKGGIVEVVSGLLEGDRVELDLK